MMRVKMKTTSAGPNGTVLAGATIDVDEQVAVDLVGGGYAEYAEPIIEDESDSLRPMETTDAVPEQETATATPVRKPKRAYKRRKRTQP